ncbi:MAG: hypothetical protein SCK28_10130 [Bacillota bacterium]|nr:hypothetical protein [Bacillota bacterium]
MSRRKSAVVVKTIKNRSWIIDYKIANKKVITIFSAFRDKELRGWSDSQVVV